MAHSGGEENGLRFAELFSMTNRTRVMRVLQTLRPQANFWEKENKLPHAGVLVTMCTVNGEPALLFTKRSQHLSSHKGQVSFPGGMQDPADSDIVQTALREATEELGLTAPSVDIWGRMMPLPNSSFDLTICPVLGFCGEIDTSKLFINKSEVAEVFTRSIVSLCDKENARMTRFITPPRGYTLPVYLGGKHRIWGITAVIVHRTLTLLAPGLYKLKLDQPRSRQES